jgi:hypothetical protein
MAGPSSGSLSGWRRWGWWGNGPGASTIRVKSAAAPWKENPAFLIRPSAMAVSGNSRTPSFATGSHRSPTRAWDEIRVDMIGLELLKLGIEERVHILPLLDELRGELGRRVYFFTVGAGKGPSPERLALTHGTAMRCQHSSPHRGFPDIVPANCPAECKSCNFKGSGKNRSQPR